MLNELRKYVMTFPLALLFLFMIIGYFEAGWNGLFAGVVLGNVAMFFLPLSLVPFIGLPLWFLFNHWLFGVVGSYLPISSLSTVIMTIIGILSGLVCVLTSILTCIGLWYFFVRKTSPTKYAKLNIPSEIQSLIKKLPNLDISKIANVQDIINQIIDFVKGFLDKLNMPLIMSIVFWFGLGLASHDFWWESQEAEVNVTRPTHGAEIGLEMAVFALDYQLSMTTPNIFDRIKREIPLYLGFVTAYFGFLLTKIVPKGFVRVICHFFWWIGIGLMVWNWYEINHGRIFPSTKEVFAESPKSF